jgi:hypothetical protein
VPKGVTILPGDRASDQHDFQVDVAVQKKLTKADNEEIDDLMGLVEEIADHFPFKRFDDFEDAVWVKTENDPVFVQEHIDQMRQFTSLLTLTFQVMR